MFSQVTELNVIGKAVAMHKSAQLVLPVLLSGDIYFLHEFRSSFNQPQFPNV